MTGPVRKHVPIRKHVIAIMGAGALALCCPGAALASGGGGGGGSGGGSFNAPSQQPSFDPAALYREGLQKYQDGNFAGAERDFRKVSREVRDNPQVHYMLGLSRMAQDEWRQASSALKKAVRLNGDFHEARAQLGLAYIRQDKMEKATDQMTELESRQAACQEADTCGPKLAKAIADLGAALNPDAEAEEVTALYGPRPVTVSAEPGDAAYLDAVRLINIGAYDEALTQLHEAEAVFGPHPDVLTYIGFANRKSGNYAQAINYYTSALTVAPDHVGANEYLGEYYVELGDMDAARAQLVKLEEICQFGCAEADELRGWIDGADAS